MKIVSMLVMIFISSSSVDANELIVFSDGDMMIATDTTTLPYNILLIDERRGSICYRGNPFNIESIIKRMITNYSSKTINLVEYEVFVEREIIRFGFSNDDEFYNGSFRQRIRYIEKCNI